MVFVNHYLLIDCFKLRNTDILLKYNICFKNQPTSQPILCAALMIGLVAGLIAVVGSCVIVLTVVVCHRQHITSRKGSETSDKAPVVASDASVSDYDPTRALGVPAARRQSLFWKGNRIVMNGEDSYLCVLLLEASSVRL